SVNCCHANQDKFWVHDPDGVEWEVYHLNYDLEDEPGRGAEPRRSSSQRISSAGYCERVPRAVELCRGGPGGALTEDQTMADEDTKRIVKDKYGKAALKVATSRDESCCSESLCCEGDTSTDPITSNLYTESETAALPPEAVAASLGCGNPTALA